MIVLNYDQTLSKRLKGEVRSTSPFLITHIARRISRIVLLGACKQRHIANILVVKI